MQQKVCARVEGIRGVGWIDFSPSRSLPPPVCSTLEVRWKRCLLARFSPAERPPPAGGEVLPPSRGSSGPRLDRARAGARLSP